MSTIGGPTGSSRGHLAYFHRYDNENENEMARERTEGKAEGRAACDDIAAPEGVDMIDVLDEAGAYHLVADDVTHSNLYAGV